MIINKNKNDDLLMPYDNNNHLFIYLYIEFYL